MCDRYVNISKKVVRDATNGKSNVAQIAVVVTYDIWCIQRTLLATLVLCENSVNRSHQRVSITTLILLWRHKTYKKDWFYFFISALIIHWFTWALSSTTTLVFISSRTDDVSSRRSNQLWFYSLVCILVGNIQSVPALLVVRWRVICIKEYRRPR